MSMEGVAVSDEHKLRQLAAWYREFAERAGNPVIWEGRLRMAENLEARADEVSRRVAHGSPSPDGDSEKSL
jgi:hypothetical protein